MKNLFSLIVAGIVGGMIALSVPYFLNTSPPIAPEFSKNEFALQTNARINKKVGTMAAPFDFTIPAKKAMPVVVHINAAESEQLAKQRRQKERSNDPFFNFFGDPFGGGTKRGSGSGVIISNDGYIVTNNHVIEYADEVEVTLYDNRQFKAKIVGKDATTDMAVLKIEARGLPTMQYPDNPNGSSFGLAGMVSENGRHLAMMPHPERSFLSWHNTGF